MLGGSADTTAQARAINGFAEGMRKAGVPQAPVIESLPELVPLANLPARDEAGNPVFGLLSTSLKPVGYTLRGSQIVIGPSGSGRTTTVLTMVQAALRATPNLSTYLLSPRRSLLTRATGLWSEAVVGADDVRDLARRLLQGVTEAGPGGATMLLVVERVQDFENTSAEDDIADLVKELVNSEQAVLGEADLTFFNSNYGLAGAFKASRSGVSLQPSGDESTAFSSDYRGVGRDQLLEGRGYIVRRGDPELVQVAMPVSEPEEVGLRPAESRAAQPTA